MNFFEVLYSIAAEKGIKIDSIGPLMGKSAKYVSANRSRGSVPSIDNAALMLEVCGFGLYAIPYEDAPKDAIRITSERNGTE